MTEFDWKKVNVAAHHKADNPAFCLSVGEFTDKIILKEYREYILFRLSIARFEIVFWNYRKIGDPNGF